VIAPLLIIQRVANKSAVTGSTVVSENIGSFRVRSRGESRGGGGATPGGYPTSSVNKYGEISGELRVGVKTEATIDSHRSSEV